MTTLSKKAIALVFACCVVGAAPPAHASTAHDIKMLKLQVKQLRASVARAQQAAADAQATIDGFTTCIELLPVGWFGSLSGTSGYTFFDGTSTFYTTALDIDDPSDPNQVPVFTWACGYHANRPRTLTPPTYRSPLGASIWLHTASTY